MYHVQYQCPRESAVRNLPADTWYSIPENPYWIYANAKKRCDELMWEHHASRIVDGAGNLVY